jgi:hypothetical protein
MNGTTDIEDPSSSSPIIFLLGPPGVGKSTLGRRACTELGLRFLDLGAAPVAATTVDDLRSDLERLTCIVADCAAAVVELPWELQHDRQALVLARKSGVPLLLWAHPEDMQARSGHDEPLFASAAPPWRQLLKQPEYAHVAGSWTEGRPCLNPLLIGSAASDG